MKIKEQILKLHNERKNIPEICSILNIGKGTVGYHLKHLGIKWDKKRTEETKRKISEAHKGKIKKKQETKPKQHKRTQEGYIDPRAYS
jgi:hypothetical protein